MAANSQDQSGGNNDPMDAFWGLLIFSLMLFAGLYYLWSQHEIAIKEATMESAMALRYIQFPFTYFGTDSYQNKIFNLDQLRYSVSAENMSNSIFIELLTVSFRSFAILLTLLYLPMGIYRLLTKHKTLFERDLSIFSLIKIQREKYPRIKPPTARNLLEINPDFGPWASHFNPIDLCLQRGMLSIETRMDLLNEQDQAVYNKRLDTLSLVGLKHPSKYLDKEQAEITYTKFKGLKHPTGMAMSETKSMAKFSSELENYIGLLRVDRSEVEQYFKESLGELCRYNGRAIDINYLPPTERAVWMLLCVCIAGKSNLRKRIEGLLDQMAHSFKEGEHRADTPSHEIDLSGVYELYNEITNNTNVKKTLVEIAQNHAYYYTAFTALYEVAKRVYGTIITRDFIWLKTVNRTLYFSLNQIGLEAPRPETAAIRSHFRAEEKLGAKISTPMIESCTLNLLHDLQEDGWTSVPVTELCEFRRAYWIGEAPAATREGTET